MALDGIFLDALGREIRERILEARVDKVYQPSREEIILSMRGRQGGAKLLLSASAGSPRIHFTTVPLENPKTPPMFCMLLRKHLSGAKLIDVRQQGHDRILFLDFETTNELGDKVTITVVMEIMGRHSNIIVVNQDGKIIDAVKRVNDEMSSVRAVLPGMKYTLPPAQDKLDLFLANREQATAAFKAAKNQDFAKSIMQVYQGVSPILSREMAYTATGGLELLKNDVSAFRMNRLFDYIDEMKQQMEQGNNCYTVVLENGKPKDFSFVDIQQYGSYLTKKHYDTASELLDGFYSERDQIERMKQRSHDLLKLLVNTSERVGRKLEAQKQELAESANRDTYKMYGDLINANLWQIQKGDSVAKVQNFYDESCPEVTIPLNIMLTPSQNAQHYYKEYRKAKTAEEKLVNLIQQGEEELVYLDSIFDAVTRTTGESELLEIREELSEQGYLKNYHNRNRMLKAQPPMKYRSSDGFTIWCGRNNKQNDRLTLKTAKNYDMWLHTQKIAGSHVVIEADGKTIPNRTIEEAAIIAAYNSHARDSAKVPVDYTLIKNVKKPNGAKPGMVIFVDYQTAYVTPDAQLVESLLCQD
ncbi:MAG: Rqc2 family fibronectin-binding protein [Massiliimalia sp.]|jgi:predicted ribosome quality control (RQC) complex YloA/Tae2 family protein